MILLSAISLLFYQYCYAPEYKNTDKINSVSIKNGDRVVWRTPCAINGLFIKQHTLHSVHNVQCIVFINQSINQSNFYSPNILGKARLIGVTAKSVFNSKIGETVP